MKDYFVSYNWYRGSSSGFGSAIYGVAGRLNGAATTKLREQIIKDSSFEKAVIVSIVPLEDEDAISADEGPAFSFSEMADTQPTPDAATEELQKELASSKQFAGEQFKRANANQELFYKVRDENKRLEEELKKAQMQLDALRRIPVAVSHKLKDVLITESEYDAAAMIRDLVTPNGGDPVGQPANFVPLDPHIDGHDMLIGPCACGATHTMGDFEVRYGRAARKTERCYAVYRTRPDENDGKEFFFSAMWHDQYRPGDGERIIAGDFTPLYEIKVEPQPTLDAGPGNLSKADDGPKVGERYRSTDPTNPRVYYLNSDKITVTVEDTEGNKKLSLEYREPSFRTAISRGELVKVEKAKPVEQAAVVQNIPGYFKINNYILTPEALAARDKAKVIEGVEQSAAYMDSCGEDFAMAAQKIRVNILATLKRDAAKLTCSP